MQRPSVSRRRLATMRRFTSPPCGSANCISRIPGSIQVNSNSQYSGWRKDSILIWASDDKGRIKTIPSDLTFSPPRQTASKIGESSKVAGVEVPALGQNFSFMRVTESPNGIFATTSAKRLAPLGSARSKCYWRNFQEECRRLAPRMGDGRARIKQSAPDAFWRQKMWVLLSGS